MRRTILVLALPFLLLPSLPGCEAASDAGSAFPGAPSDAVGPDAIGADAGAAPDGGVVPDDAAAPGDVPAGDVPTGDVRGPDGADSAPPVDVLPVAPTDEATNRIDAGTYVIVTTAELAPAWERLADWRRRTGLPAVVATMEEVRQAADGVDDADRLRRWIRGAVTERGARIVLLGGDTPLVPHRSVHVHTRLGFGDLVYETEAFAATELYFADLDGDWDGDGDGAYGEIEDGLDMAPDVAIGRVPAATAAEVDGYIDKVLAYERAEADDYQDRVLFLSEYTGFGSLDASLMLDTWDGRIFDESFTIEKLYDDPSHYPDAAPNTWSGEVRALEEGKGIVAHLGHGSEGSFAFLDLDDVTALDHAPRFNVFFSCACYSGNFAADGVSTGERFVLNPLGGGVAYVGNTDIGIGFPSGATYLAQLLRLLLGPDPPRVGEAFAEARTTFVPNGGGVHEDLHADRYTMFVIDLLGDPGLRMWRGRPRTVSVDAPSTVGAADPLGLTVRDAAGAPVPDATVTLLQPDRLLVVTRTDAAGEVRLVDLDAAPGPLDVTVSGDGLRPATATVTVE